MDPARTLLNRELLVSALVHELRGRITAVQGFAELDAGRHGARIGAAHAGMTDLVATLSETASEPAGIAEFRGVPVRVRGPIEVLETAIAGLPHRAMELEL